ncbi:hypothetical protein [Mobiluncus mulieris]|uniref:Uncharacterized protein n=1 Tax=Mobiluncus mulieris TaxID=2052 RepID=A0A7Y0Y3Z1_9ACTO|nr:hypothetical protein [Mobiluncus mulieris]NMW61685.1 hypothetical protein [Mobiluncus mulieris]NMW63919.1 hypothetical protein [Mobiluncus mulieris]NMW64893.1 hypothetical protein [Mobiluncus mulieris]NMW76173.1 hypothetical protein [Mobiluncus mulieris]NMW82326.1 hypothetical protein [Mobiluncus mulieris]
MKARPLIMEKLEALEAPGALHWASGVAFGLGAACLAIGNALASLA